MNPMTMPQQQPAYDQPALAPAPKRSRAALIVTLAVVAAVVILTAAGIAYFAFGRGGGELAAANSACNDGRTDVLVADGGRTMVIDAVGEKQILGPVDRQTEACILEKLKMPASVMSHIENTRAMDGRQTDSWGDFTASWVYHPDDGLDITIVQK